MIRLVRCVATLLVAWVAFEAGRADHDTALGLAGSAPWAWLPWIAAGLATLLAGIGWLADAAAEYEAAQADRLRQQRDQRRAERDTWRDAYLLDRGAAAAWREDAERYRAMLTHQQAVTRSWRDLAQELGKLAAYPGVGNGAEPDAAACPGPAAPGTDPTLEEKAAPTLEQPLPVDGRPR